MRQLQGLAAYLPSYLSSQWVMCSTEADSFSMGMARSTGITCMPMPAPPGGTMAVTRSRGSWVMRSNILATWGCSSIWDWRMLKNSAEPGTKGGST